MIGIAKTLEVISRSFFIATLPVVLWLLPFSVSAEESRDTFSAHVTEHEEIWLLLDDVQQVLQQTMQKQASIGDVHRIMQIPCETTVDGRYESRLFGLEQEKNALKNRTDLDLRGGYSNRDLVDEGETSAYLELDWELLRDGYLEKRKRESLVEAKLQLTTYLQTHYNSTQQQACRHYQLPESFLGIKNRLLLLKRKLMSAVDSIERRAYLRGWSYLDDALISESEIALLDRELAYIKRIASESDDLIKVVNLPALDVDFEQIKQRMLEASSDDQQLLLEQQLAEKNNQKSYQDRLQLYLRKSFDVDGQGDGDSTTLGFRFSVPFDRQQTNYQRATDLMEAQYNSRSSSHKRLIKLREAYEDIHQQQQRLIAQQYRYLTAYERYRRSVVKYHLDGASEVAGAVLRLRSLLQSVIELVNAKESLYLRVNHIFRVAELSYQADLVKQLPLPQANYRSRVGHRDVYIWSAFFNRVPNQQIFDLLASKGIEGVLLSLGKRTDAAKARRFINQAAKLGVAVEVVVGSNEWIYPEKSSSMLSTVQFYGELLGGVHLDVEPHTMKGYRANPKAYLDNYLNMLTIVRAHIGSARLSVSVPTHWPDEVYQKINFLADHIYLMSYEANVFSRQQSRLERLYTVLDREKTVLVLNLKEFEDEWALEQLIGQLNQQMEVTAFGLHSIEGYLK